MDKKIKAKWLRALRSGKYKQAKGVLRTEKGGFCCLGVLCDVVDKTQWSPVAELIETTVGGKDLHVRGFQFMGCQTSLPAEIRDRVGISWADLSTINDLIKLNDSGKRFTTIANHIAETL